MKWYDLERPWQLCFELAWESFIKGSVPIGAVITNEKSEIIAKGRNMQSEKNADVGEIAYHKISHAELNAIVKVSEFDHPNIRKYTIYSTTEPCPMCFGTIVMANIRNIKFAARDKFAGATDLNNANDYIKSKNISIVGPIGGLEEVQIALHSSFEFMININYKKLFDAWRIDCPDSVDLGITLAKDGTIEKLIKNNEKASDVFDLISSMLKV
jgi:tRNA(adenine34) deaminase